MQFRCPKCRGGDLVISEIFEASDYIRIEDGEVVWRGPGEAVSASKFSAECDCGHRWHPRLTTGMRAVDAAQDVEAR